MILILLQCLYTAVVCCINRQSFGVYIGIIVLIAFTIYANVTLHWIEKERTDTLSQKIFDYNDKSKAAGRAIPIALIYITVLIWLFYVSDNEGHQHYMSLLRTIPEEYYTILRSLPNINIYSGLHIICFISFCLGLLYLMSIIKCGLITCIRRRVLASRGYEVIIYDDFFIQARLARVGKSKHENDVHLLWRSNRRQLGHRKNYSSLVRQS